MAALNAVKKCKEHLAKACAARVVALERPVEGFAGFEGGQNGSLERKKHVAGACSCERGCLGHACGTV